MKYKLVASDFDGTLMPPSKIISEYTKLTIKRYVEEGGTFVICSGRMYRSIHDEAVKMGLHGIAISYQGALIKDIDSEKTLYMEVISPDLAVEYVNFMNKMGATVQMYVDDNLCVEKKNPYTDRYVAYCEVPFNEVGDLATFIKNNTRPINKVFCHVPKESCAEIREAAAKRFGDRLMISSSGPWNVEAVNIAASKGKAITKLAEIMNIDISEVMALGDNLNDADMIETAGFGVAVGDAVQEVKDIADYVCENCGDDGVAKTIQKYCL